MINKEYPHHPDKVLYPNFLSCAFCCLDLQCGINLQLAVNLYHYFHGAFLISTCAYIAVHKGLDNDCNVSESKDPMTFLSLSFCVMKKVQIYWTPVTLIILNDTQVIMYDIQHFSHTRKPKYSMPSVLI